MEPCIGEPIYGTDGSLNASAKDATIQKNLEPIVQHLFATKKVCYIFLIYRLFTLEIMLQSLMNAKSLQDQI